MTINAEFNHADLLNELNKKASVTEKINSIHQAVRQSCDFIHRIGIALYDSKTEIIRTFAHATDIGNPLPHYEAKLAEAHSLRQIYLEGKPRVINDLSVFKGNGKEHSSRIDSHGYRASYTVPMYHNEQLTGFMFFNSRDMGVFKEDKLQYLDMVARLISLLVSVELNQVQTLQGALKTAICFSSHKDPETGAHLERMARYSRLIANEIAPLYGMNDEFVETIFWFAPMHDIGKIAIPDHILLKPGKFTSEEFEIMKTHTIKGREIIDSMLSHFNLSNSDFIPMLSNISEYHHENLDGSGYPHGLQGENIPIEARIIAVADVFDALASKRPYKDAWSNKDAFAELKALSAWKLDQRCVDILVNNSKKVEEIQRLFLDEQKHSQNAIGQNNNAL